MDAANRSTDLLPALVLNLPRHTKTTRTCTRARPHAHDVHAHAHAGTDAQMATGRRWVAISKRTTKAPTLRRRERVELRLAQAFFSPCWFECLKISLKRSDRTGAQRKGWKYQLYQFVIAMSLRKFEPRFLRASSCHASAMTSNCGMKEFRAGRLGCFACRASQLIARRKSSAHVHSWRICACTGVCPCARDPEAECALRVAKWDR